MADENGLRRDVVEAIRKLRMPLMRYPGSHFVSSRDRTEGIGPRDCGRDGATLTPKPGAV